MNNYITKRNIRKIFNFGEYFFLFRAVLTSTDQCARGASGHIPEGAGERAHCDYEDDGRHCGDGDEGCGFDGVLCGGFYPVELAYDEEIIIQGNRGVDGGDEDEIELTALEGGREEEPFADKAHSGGEANEAKQADEQGEGEEWCALVKARYRVDGDAVFAAPDFANDEEARKRHGKVANGVKEGGSKTPFGEGLQGKEHITGVGDCGVSEQAFEVFLRERGQVAQAHCDDACPHERGLGVARFPSTGHGQG